MDNKEVKNNINIRNIKNKMANILFGTIAFLSILILLILLSDLFKRGFRYINLNFLTSFPSSSASNAGIFPALVGSVWIILLTALIAIPISIAAALYIEEYAPNNRFIRLIKINISNLAGVPSIIYGILGLTFFVRTLGFGRSILAGALTLALLIMPILIVTTQEALRAVPDSLRHGAYTLGASKWQAIKKIVLPAALPGIATGVILSISRALGESAPLLLIGGFSFVSSLPTGVMDSFISLPIQIYTWMSKPSASFKDLTAAAIIILMVLLLILNMTAIVIRNKFSKSFD